MRKVLNLQQILLLIFSILFCCSCGVESPAPVPVPPPPPLPPPAQPEPPPPDTTPPEIIITGAPEEIVDVTEVTFEWNGTDDRTPTVNLTYSYYLEGFDTDYSQFTSDTARTYSDLASGPYVFHVKAKDEAGNISPTPATAETIIAPVPPVKSDVPFPLTSRLLLVPGSEVNRIAVGGYGNIVYALDSVNAQLYKSEHGGYGWENVSNDISGAATWDALATAPDNPKIVAVATNGGTEIYLSIDGSNNFMATKLAGKLGPGERVKCIAISPNYGRNTWEIAAGTSTGNGGGKIWVNIIDGFPSGWQDLSTGAPGWLPPVPATPGVDVFAIEYSPAFAADGTVLAIIASGPNSNTGDTYLHIGTRDLATNNMVWNRFSGYPVEICQAGQDTPGTPLTYADLALPSDYSGSRISQRHVYACWSDNPPGVATAGNNNDDVYRLDDVVCYRLQARPDVIGSLAHYGFYSSGKLLAGAMTSAPLPHRRGTQTYFTLNPQSTCPTWQQSQKPPTGTHNAQVAWSPDGRIAYCGTSGGGGAGYDQSAFSISTNNGLTWNQTGLIDT